MGSANSHRITICNTHATQIATSCAAVTGNLAVISTSRMLQNKMITNMQVYYGSECSRERDKVGDRHKHNHATKANTSKPNVPAQRRVQGPRETADITRRIVYNFDSRTLGWLDCLGRSTSLERRQSQSHWQAKSSIQRRPGSGHPLDARRI